MLAIWKAFIYEPPTHKIALYEKAPSTRGNSITIGPNKIAIKSVARNRYDGAIAVESGKGRQLVGRPPGAAVLSGCAPWLDVVQIELDPGPDRFEVMEVRICEHESRTLLSSMDQAYGWQVIQPNLLHVYGWGKEVPSLIDVWLRGNSHHADDHVITLAPTTGSVAAVPNGQVVIREIQSGFAGWSSSEGFMPLGDDDHGGCALLLDWSGDWQDARYQITAVSVFGEKEFAGLLLPLHQPSQSTGPITLMPLEEVDHFELRPFGGRHRFFFEAVELPANNGRSFDAPPIITLPIGGESADVILSELAPLHVRLTVEAGDTIRGSTANQSLSRMIRRSEPTDTGQSFTLAYQVWGIAALPIAFRFADVQSGDNVSSKAYGSAGGHGASGTSHGTWATVYRVPIERVEAIEVSLGLVF